MIVFFGGPLLDVIAKVDLKYLEKYDLKPDETVSATPELQKIFTDILDFNPIILPGGSVTNSARVMNWICRHTYQVVFAGAVGDDQFGQLIRSRFEEERIHHHLVMVPGVKTGICAVLLTGQNRTLVTHLGASKCFTKDNLGEPMWVHLRKAEYIYMSAFFLGVSFEVIQEIFSHFKDNSKTIIINLAATFLSRKYPKEITYLFRNANIVFGNENEYKAFLFIHYNQNCSTIDILPKLNDIFPCESNNRLLIMTRGDKPILVFHSLKVHQFPIPSINKEDIVDSDGAGDAFVGGFLAQYVHGKNLQECVKCGMWTAKQVLQQHGCSFDQNKLYQE